MFTKNIQFLFINISLILIVIILKSTSFSLLEWINITFYFALIYMIMTLFIYTVRGGFYDGLVFGMKRAHRIMSKHRDLFEEDEKELPVSEKINQKFYQVARFQFFSLSIILILSLMIYYSMK